MNSMREGIPLAGFATFMNLWIAVMYGPQLWQAWGSIAWARVGLLLLAGGLACTLMNVWSLVVESSRERLSDPLRLPALPSAESSDV